MHQELKGRKGNVKARAKKTTKLQNEDGLPAAATRHVGFDLERVDVVKKNGMYSEMHHDSRKKKPSFWEMRLSVLPPETDNLGCDEKTVGRNKNALSPEI